MELYLCGHEAQHATLPSHGQAGLSILTEQLGFEKVAVCLVSVVITAGPVIRPKALIGLAICSVEFPLWNG